MSTPGSHLTLDELADALAGERAGDPHLAGCDACGDRLAELSAAEASVRAQLAHLPDPPLPAGLADRLSAALAAEPPLPRATPATATVTPLADRRRRAWLPAAAAAAVLVLGGGLGLTLLSGFVGGGDESTSLAGGDAGSGGAVADTAVPVTSDTGVDYGDDAALTAALPQVLAGGAGESTRAMSDPLADAAAPAAEPAPEAATTSEDADATALAGAAQADGLARLRDPAVLASCLAALLPPDEPDVRPLALDYAQYQGTPALAVVLPDPDPAKLAVFVVGPGCSQEDDSTLRFVRVDRP